MRNYHLSPLLSEQAVEQTYHNMNASEMIFSGSHLTRCEYAIVLCVNKHAICVRPCAWWSMMSSQNINSSNPATTISRDGRKSLICWFMSTYMRCHIASSKMRGKLIFTSWHQELKSISYLGQLSRYCVLGSAFSLMI